MEEVSLIPRVSCHHGDVACPNNLEAALRVAAAFPTIDVYEIDFVCDDKRIVSSHDYESRVIARGSEVERWLEEIVVKRDKILWLDVKQNLDIFFGWAYGTFDADLLFAKLAEARTKWGASLLKSRVWIGCQEETLRVEIAALSVKHDWHFILDMPSVAGYVTRCLTPRCLTPQFNASIDRKMRATDYQQYDIISIDRSFFAGPKELKRFVVSLHLRPEVLVVLNSFPRSQPPLLIEDTRIVMQYDYTTLSGERLK